MRSRPRWFALALRLLPRRLRETYGDEISALAEEYARGRSWLGRTSVWLRAGLDVVGVALRARLGWRAVGGASMHGGMPRTGRWDGFDEDVRYALRSLRREARLSLFVMTIVGLGVGACVTVFSVARALLLRPLPFDRPERLVWVSNGDFGPGQRLSEISVQVAYVVGLRANANQLEEVGGYHLFDGDGDHTLLRGGEPERVTRLRVTGNFFDVLGVEPAIGRLFTDEEAWDDGPPAILLTWGFFMRRFAGDGSIVGQAVDVDGVPTTVIGILPSTFDFTSIFAPGRRIDYVSAFPLSPRSNRTGNTLGLIARLAPGATPRSATAEASAIASRVVAERLNSFEPVVRPLREHVAGRFRPALAVLTGAVLLVLLIVCANLSNLLLARGATREREMAIRAAIGAPRHRLVRQMLVESMMLSGAGALVGIAVGFLGTRLLAGLDLRIPLLDEAHVDAPAMAVGVVAALLVGVVFGVAPALRGTAVRLHESLKDSARGSSAGRGQGVLRSALVVSEVALACMLMIASTLLARSFLEVVDIDLGYQADRTVAIRIDPSVRFASNEARVAYYADVLDRMRVVPGVEAAGLSDVLPMGFNRTWSARRPDAPPEESAFSFVRMASDGYVDAMGLTLVAGRDLSPEDGPDTPLAALVNERLASLLWPGASAVGQRLTSSGREYTVVGVVGDTRQLSVEQDPGPEVFFSIRQSSDQAAVHLLLRGTRSVDDFLAAARSELRAVDPGLPLDQVVSIRDIVDASIAPRRFLVGLLAVFALFALVLASLGIYGVISYSVAQRRREIGIHIALGASAGVVQARILRQTMTLTGLGLGVGVVLAIAGGRFLESLLFGVTVLDPATYAGVAALLGLVAAVAGFVPARRAATTHPLDALDGEAPGLT